MKHTLRIIIDSPSYLNSKNHSLFHILQTSRLVSNRVADPPITTDTLSRQGTLQKDIIKPCLLNTLHTRKPNTCSYTKKNRFHIKYKWTNTFRRNFRNGAPIRSNKHKHNATEFPCPTFSHVSDHK